MKYFVMSLLIALSGAAYAGSYADNQKAAVERFQSDQEPTAKDAVWTDRDIFKVGVIDNGSPRDGYAQYVCMALDDIGFKGDHVWVQIIDIGQLNRSGRWVKLGEAHCQ